MMQLGIGWPLPSSVTRPVMENGASRAALMLVPGAMTTVPPWNVAELLYHSSAPEPSGMKNWTSYDWPATMLLLKVYLPSDPVSAPSSQTGSELAAP